MVRFHVGGLKCMECGSYNTSREGEKRVSVAAVPLPQAAHAPQDDEQWETEDEEERVGDTRRLSQKNKTQWMI